MVTIHERVRNRLAVVMCLRPTVPSILADTRQAYTHAIIMGIWL